MAILDGFRENGQVNDRYQPARSNRMILLLIGGAVVLLFNTAAILAMLRHYREDRDFMYGLDIKFLDEARAAKG